MILPVILCVCVCGNLSDFGVRVLLALWSEFRSVPSSKKKYIDRYISSSEIFLNSLRQTGVISSLNVW